MCYARAVVPYYFLVWYNMVANEVDGNNAVVPYYFLVWYNHFGNVNRTI